MLKIGHTVKVPTTLRGPNAKEEITIPIPQELEGVPGANKDEDTVNYYTRNYPVESHNVENFVYRKWSRAISDIKEIRDEHERLNKPIVLQARESGDIEPTAEPTGRDVTAEIKAKAMELGYAMVGMTAYDNRYTYVSKRKWVKPYPNVVCLAMEQPYEKTQDIPSEPAEEAVFATYRKEGAAGLELGDFIRSLGYHAQVHSPNDPGSVVIPMLVAAGMGQQGAMGYLLSPHFGSRHRLMLITTDAPVTHDQPVDYGVPEFCTICQVCVNRCPGRALMRDKVWWRGVEKFKIVAKRCRPVMAAYASCAVCMKVCPVQRYGLKTVMEHYAATGQVLGKGTHELEGYELEGLGYFGPGELPRFDADFFHNPEGTAEEFVLEELKAKIQSGLVPEGAEGDKVFQEFRAKMEEAVMGGGDVMEAEWYALEAGE
jgi:NAD-dependent dihydropyrimidine dehydrogenase PreA subunit